MTAYITSDFHEVGENICGNRTASNRKEQEKGMKVCRW